MQSVVENMRKTKVGYSRSEITPQGTSRMAGFDLRKALSVGVLDPLYITVLFLEDLEGGQLIVCSYDLLGVDSQFCELVRKEITNRCVISDSDILISATHTHSAPGNIFSNKDKNDIEYVNFLIETTIVTVEKAIANASFSIPYMKTTNVRNLACIRTEGPGQDFIMRTNLLVLEREEDKVVLCLLQCHPTILDENNLFLSRDLIGSCEKFLDNKYQYIFLNGACGDISTRYTRNESNIAELNRLGSILANDINEAIKNTEVVVDLHLRTVKRSLFLSGAKGLSDEKRKELIALLEEKIENCEENGLKREYQSRLAVLKRPNYGKRSGRNICISVTDAGAFIIVGLPLELNSLQGKKYEELLRKISKKTTWIACYTGGYDGYLPSERPLDFQSNYEDIAAIYQENAQIEVRECIIDCVNELMI